jgi:hypothetical protein
MNVRSLLWASKERALVELIGTKEGLKETLFGRTLRQQQKTLQI